MSAVSLPPGGTAYVYSAFANVVNAAWDLGNLKATAYETKIDNATGTWLATVPTMSPAAVSPVPTVTEPAVFIPTSIDISSIMSTFDTKYLELVTLLSDKFALFLSTYFPSESTTYNDAQTWLHNEISNPDRVLPAALANIIWEEDRSRITADAVRAADDVMSVFAAKRFPLPPGAAAKAAVEIQQKAQDQLAASSRNVATKTFEMAYDKVKFAVENAIKLRSIAVSSAGDYIKALASGPEMATHLVGLGYDAQSKLISSVSQFYGARTEATKLTASINTQNATFEQEAAKTNLTSTLTTTENRLKALLAEAQDLATMATALFNNLHANAGITGSDNVNWSK